MVCGWCDSDCDMASFLTRLVACLVAIIAILQLIHLVLLNKLESERLLELHHFQSYSSEREVAEEIKVAHLHRQPHHSPPNPSLHSSAAGASGVSVGAGAGVSVSMVSADSIINGRARRSQMGWNEIHQQKDGNEPASAHDGQDVHLDPTKKFRIIPNVNQLISNPNGDTHLINSLFVAQLGVSPQTISARTRSGDEDFSIDNENEATNTNANFVSKKFPRTALLDNDVTLVLHATIRKVQQHLLQVVERWLGPISVAVFAQTTHELNQTIAFVQQVIQCHQLTKEIVNFHFVFPVTFDEKFQALLYDRPLAGADSTSSSGVVTKSKPNGRKSKKKKQRTKNGNSKKLSMCQKFYHKLSNTEPESDQQSNYNKGEGEPAVNAVEYPVNLLRNIARKYVHTKYTLVSDIELIPSDFLRVGFQNFVKSSPVDNSKTVFVVPAFEVMNRKIQDVPGSKQQLLNLLEKYEARPFSFDICWKCQVNTDYETWQRESSSNTQELSILVETLWRDPWEPFFISDNSAPLYDERFTLSSQKPLQSQPSDYARLSQLCEMHMDGYKFAILKDVFLVHNGFRDLSDISSSLTSSSLSLAASSNTNFDIVQTNYEDMKVELKVKYPQSPRTCD